MARIKKGFALTITFFGLLSFTLGLVMSIVTWILVGKFKRIRIHIEDGNRISFKRFYSYWWGGLIYLFPGVFGIIAGCTKKVIAMVLYLISNIISLICSTAATVLVAVLVVNWAVINSLLTKGDEKCIDINLSCHCKNVTYHDTKYDMYFVNTTCESLKNAAPLLSTIMAMAVLSSIVSFFASYVSCCALAHKEDQRRTIIIEPGAGNYQPPSHIIPSYHHYQPPPQRDTAPNSFMSFNQLPPQSTRNLPQYTSTNDKSKLVENEVIH